MLEFLRGDLILVILLKGMIFLASITALFVSFLMLVFFDKFVALNKYFGRKRLTKYDFAIFDLDEFVSSRSYILSVVLFVVGLMLLTVFITYLLR